MVPKVLQDLWASIDLEFISEQKMHLFICRYISVLCWKKIEAFN